MKMDKHQIKLIIKLLLVVIMLIIIYFIGSNMRKQENEHIENEMSKINEVNFSDATQRY